VAAALPASEVQTVEGGFRIHVNGDGQPQSPWFAITAAYALPVIAASPNPILVPAGSVLGQTTISWSAPRYATVEVRVNAPDGPLMAMGGSTGSEQTGLWVTNGTRFFLVDPAGGATLAAVTVAVQPQR
jgi:hypothetical protein